MTNVLEKRFWAIASIFRLSSRRRPGTIGLLGDWFSVAFYFGEIDRVAFRDKFGLELEQAFPEQLQYVKKHGLMCESQGQNDASAALSLTELGAQNFSSVIALFFAPSVQHYLIERDPESATDMDRHRDRAERVARAGGGVSAMA